MTKLLIPKIIHQTYHSKTLPINIFEIVEDFKKNNPDWEYRFYDNNQCSEYIFNNFGQEFLDIYDSINASYGAAKADFFRYLVLYREGGAYFDIKSACTIPLSELIQHDDEFFISNWPNDYGEFKGAGLKIELRNIPHGEYQQWYIITKPESPFLKAVIDRVVRNIKNYNPWKFSVAKRGVLKVTGPIPYTLAIHPLKNKYPHRYSRYHTDFFLKYSLLKGNNDHIAMMKNHYSLSIEPIIYPKDKRDVILHKSFIIFRFFTNVMVLNLFFNHSNYFDILSIEFNKLLNSLKRKYYL